MGQNEEEISPSDESNSVSHFVQFIFSSSWVGDDEEISPGDES